MSYYFYVIYSSQLDKYYLGHTGDIELRIQQHNSGMSNFTAKASDWDIVYTEVFDSREAARARESEVKRKKSRKYIEWLISNQ